MSNSHSDITTNRSLRRSSSGTPPHHCHSRVVGSGASSSTLSGARCGSATTSPSSTSTGYNDVEFIKQAL
jgi:hypothetical protein